MIKNTRVYKSLLVRLGKLHTYGENIKNTRVGKSLPVCFMGCICWFLQSCFEQLFGEFVDIILDLFAALGARVL